MSMDFKIWLRLQQALPNLDRKLGSKFSMSHPPGLTEGQKSARRRAAVGWRGVGLIPPEAVAAMLYLRKQWGFGTNIQTVSVALLYLAQQTRQGLDKIDFD